MNSLTIKRITTLGSAAICMAALLAVPMKSSAKNILDIKSTAHDRDISYPESFETDVKKMHENWYLRNYTVLERDNPGRQTVATTDEEYITRLRELPTVIEMPFNSIVKSYIEMYVERKPQLVETMLGLSLYYMPIFEQALDRHGLPLELKYLPVIESALNPEAVSRAGAVGLWQFMLPTAKGLGLEKNSLIDQRCDPYLSSDAAARYLKELYVTYGDWTLALAAYNCGPGNVNKALRRAGGGKKDFWEIYPFLPSETRGYVPLFIAANYAMTHYDKHNISPALARRPLVTDTVHVSNRVHFEQISEVLDIPMEEIKVLNPQFRQDVIPGDIKPYSLVLPSMQVYAYIANEDSIINHNAAKYARRDIVEPSTGLTNEGTDSRGRYIEEITVKRHTVKRGETLASIARKYGVTASSIRSTNRIGRTVRRGQKLTINVATRRYLPQETAAPDTTAAITPATCDSVSGDTVVNAVPAPAPTSPAVTDSATSGRVTTPAEVEHARPVTTPTPARRQNNTTTTNAQPARPTTHKIKSGENLSVIARRYGITVDALKRANNMSNDNIRAGQTLTIPPKAKKSSRRRGRR